MLKKLSWIGYLIGSIGVGYFLWIHQAHVLQYIPFVFLLLCPLMHLFGGHGHNQVKSCHKSEDSKGNR